MYKVQLRNHAERVERVRIFRCPLEVGDPEGSQFEEVEALVDTGATFTVVPGRILQRLGVGRKGKVGFRLASVRRRIQTATKGIVREAARMHLSASRHPRRSVIRPIKRFQNSVTWTPRECVFG